MNEAPARRKFRVLAIVSASVVGLSLLVGLTDFGLALFGYRPTLSKHIAVLRDGGTTIHVGFGYRLVHWQRLDGDLGPEIWFWFLPFSISETTQRKGIHWIWTKDAFAPFYQTSV
jgi:hypothetical protein